MKCESPNSKCECKDCIYFNNFYCEYFKSDHMCYKCDWNGKVSYCPNKIEKKNIAIIEEIKNAIKSTVGKTKYNFNEIKSSNKVILEEIEILVNDKKTEKIDECLKTIADMQKINSKDDKK